jgi:divalent metal cation (Fe/Co/Zn/Cd) transporter
MKWIGILINVFFNLATAAFVLASYYISRTQAENRTGIGRYKAPIIIAGVVFLLIMGAEYQSSGPLGLSDRQKTTIVEITLTALVAAIVGAIDKPR